MNESYRQAYNLAYRLAGNPGDAEDLLQDAYIRAYRFFDKYDRSLPFTSWLYRIITNVHIDSIRKNSKFKLVSIDQQSEESDRSWEIVDQSQMPDKELMCSTLAEPLQNALQEMNPDFRTAVLLADVECLSYEEIADIMSSSVGTVRSRVHRGRKQLKRNLDRMGVVEKERYLS